MAKAKAKVKARSRPARPKAASKAKAKPAAKKAKPVAKAKTAKRATSRAAKAATPSAPVSTAPTTSTVTRAQLLEALAINAPTLAADPMFRHRANAPFDRAELERYFTAKPQTTLEELFADTLQGMIQSVRYAGLRVIKAIYGDLHSVTKVKTLEIAEDQTIAIVGDLTVDGDLVNDGVLVVTGNATISGAVISPPFAYSLTAVGGTLKARDVSTSGEILVGDRLEASRLVHLLYNDYSSVLPSLKAQALVIEDNFPALGAVDAARRYDDTPDDDGLRAIFGQNIVIVEDEDGEPPIRRLIR